MPTVDRTPFLMCLCALLLAGCATHRGREPAFPHNECDPELPDPCVAQLARHAAAPARPAGAPFDCPESVQ